MDRLYRKKSRSRSFTMRVSQTAKKSNAAKPEPIAPDPTSSRFLPPEPIIRRKSGKRNVQPVFHVRSGTGAISALKRASGRIHGSVREKTAEWKRIVPAKVYQSSAMQWAKRLFRGFVMCVMILMSAALFYLLIIMGDSFDSGATRQGEGQAQMESISQSPLHVDSGKINDAKKYFNASILRLSEKSKWKLTDIWVLDEQPAGVGMIVREVRLLYQNEDTGSEVVVSSITPSRYLRALSARGFAAVEGEALVMANMRGAVMSDGATLHAHSQNGESIYQIEGQVSIEELKNAAAAASLLR